MYKYVHCKYYVKICHRYIYIFYGISKYIDFFQFALISTVELAYSGHVYNRCIFQSQSSEIMENFIDYPISLITVENARC